MITDVELEAARDGGREWLGRHPQAQAAMGYAYEGDVREFLRAALTAAAAARPAQDWQPIETAPKDGTQIWGWDGKNMATIIWAGDPPFWLKTWNDADFNAVKWLPIPLPPAATDLKSRDGT